MTADLMTLAATVYATAETDSDAFILARMALRILTGQYTTEVDFDLLRTELEAAL